MVRIWSAVVACLGCFEEEHELQQWSHQSFCCLFNYVTQSVRFPYRNGEKLTTSWVKTCEKIITYQYIKKQPLRLFQTSPKKNCLPVAPPSHLGPLSRRTRSTRGKRNPRPRVGSCAIPRCLLRRGPHAKCVPLQNVCSLEFVVSCEFAIHLYLISIWYNDTCITQPIIIFPEFLLDHSIIISTLYIYYYMYFMRVLHVLSYSHYHGKTTSAWISWAAAQSLT